MIGGDSIKKLKVVLTAEDKTGDALKSTESRFAGLGQKAKMAGLAIGALAVGIGVQAVNAAVDFEKRMMNVGTLVDTSTESIKDMGKEVLKLSKTMPISAADLSDSLYQVRSAGISAADQFKVLEASGKLAVAGLGTAKESTDLLTSAINAFGMKGDDANKAADVLFKTVKAGKTTVADLAQSFGQVAPVAAAMKVKFEDLQAATAALTVTGLQTSVAQSQLRAAIVALQKPTADMTVLIQKAGYASGAAALAQDSLGVVFSKVKAAAGGNSEALAKAWSSVEALNAATSIAGEQNKLYTANLETMTGATLELAGAFDKQKGTTAAQFEMLKNNYNATLIELGVKILPTVNKAMNILVSNMDVIGKTINVVIYPFKELNNSLNRSIFLLSEMFYFIMQISNAFSKLGSLFGGAGAKPAALTTPIITGGLSQALNKKAVSSAVGKIGEFLSPVVSGPTSPIVTEMPGAKKESNFNFNFSGAFVGDKNAFMDEIKKAINRESELKALGGL